MKCVVLAGGRGGVGVFMLPSAGYLVGYAFAAGATGLIMGWLPRSSPRQAALSAFIASLLGGVLLGVIEIFAGAYISTQLANAIVFLVLIIVLLVKPTGLLGKKIREKV